MATRDKEFALKVKQEYAPQIEQLREQNGVINPGTFAEFLMRLPKLNLPSDQKNRIKEDAIQYCTTITEYARGLIIVPANTVGYFNDATGIEVKILDTGLAQKGIDVPKFSRKINYDIEKGTATYDELRFYSFRHDNLGDLTHMKALEIVLRENGIGILSQHKSDTHSIIHKGELIFKWASYYGLPVKAREE